MASLSLLFVTWLTLIWVAYVFGDNLAAIDAAGTVLFSGNSADFDSIQAAQMMGRLDMVALLLAMLGIIFALAGLFGFWIFRREAIHEARTVAEDVARKTANEFYGSGRSDKNGGQPGAEPKPAPVISQDAVSTVGAVPETEGGDDDGSNGPS